MSNNPILLKENSKLMNEYNFKKNTEFNLDTLTLGSNKKFGGFAQMDMNGNLQ